MLHSEKATHYHTYQPENRMNISKTPLVAAAVTAMLAIVQGCAVNSLTQALKSDHNRLSASSIHTLVAGKNLHLTAIDFDAEVLFKDNQKLAAKNRSGEIDTGQWDITSDDMLCLDFDKWYFGDVRCYTVFSERTGDNYIFFTENGARYYSAKPLATIPAALISLGTSKKRTSYLKGKKEVVAAPEPTEVTPEVMSRPEPPAPEPGPEEMKRILITTARDCPACNLAGVDLRGAELVGANLAGANLAGADLTGANMRRANLSGADLQNARLRATNLPGANLTGCNLTQADLSGANLIKANLTGSATKGALFTDALTEGTTGIK